MAQLQSYDIVGSYNNQRVSSIDSERSINLFEYIDALGKKPKTLLPTSGLLNTAISFPSASGGFRSSFVFNNLQYHVIGNRIFQVNSSGAVLQINNVLLSTSGGYVGVDANNNNEIMWVDGTNGYIYNTKSHVFVVKNQSTDPNFPANPLDICFLDGFLVIISGGTNNFQLSGLNQATVWGANASTFTVPTANTLTLASTTNFQTGIPVTVSSTATLPTGLSTGTTYFVINKTSTTLQLATSQANAYAGTNISITAGSGSGTFTITVSGQVQLGSITSHPGTLVACRTLHRRIFFFSQFFTEVWENAGIGTNLPFRRNNALLMEYGAASIGSVSVGFDKLFFLSQDRDGLGAVMEVMGTESIPVSTRALDFQLAQYAQGPGVSDATSLLIKENGLIFYRLNFTNANATYVYNVTLSNPQSDETKFWHEEQILNGSRHPAQTHIFFGGSNYYGDYLNPNLYFVDPSYVTNDGESIKRTRIGKPYAPETYQRLRIDRFHLDLVQGSNTEQFADTFFPILTENVLDILTESGSFLVTEDSSLSDSLISIPDLHPRVFLSYSKDGGQSYGFRLNGQMGAIGQRTFRTVWRKLGTVPRGQSFVPKIEFYAQVPFVVLGAAWTYEVMPE